VILVVSAFCIPLATQLMGSDPVIPSGASGPIDIHKSLIDRMSLLSISQEGSEGDSMATSTWILLLVFGFTIISEYDLMSCLSESTLLCHANKCPTTIDFSMSTEV
jgi:hypothetical protein